MKINFERSGGFAGLRTAATFDTESLPSEESRRLQEELERARFFDLPAKLDSPAGGADRFEYKITVEDKGRRHIVEFGEAAAPESLQPLIQRLSDLARSQRGQ